MHDLVTNSAIHFFKLTYSALSAVLLID